MMVIAAKYARKALLTVGIAVTLIVLSMDRGAHAAEVAPVKQVILAHFGHEGVGKDEFMFPVGVAVAPGGNIYVADTANSRIQELTANGEFVSMFGWEVNRTKDETAGATQAEKNLCAAASGDVCKAGVTGGRAGQISAPQSIVVDQAGNVYVQEAGEPRNPRVDKFTAEGQFVWMIGDDVNKTKAEKGASAQEADVCTSASGDECQQGEEGSVEDTMPGAFKFGEASGDRLAVGGSEEMLYVGDKHRVQKFDPDTGEFAGEIRLTGISEAPESEASTLALDNSCALHQPQLTEITIPTCKEFDPEYGDIFLVYEVEGKTNIIRKLSQSGTEVKDGHFPLLLSPRTARGEVVHVSAIALDTFNRLSASEYEPESGGTTKSILFGSLYSGSTGSLITEFTNENAVGLSFGEDDELYGAVAVHHEIVRYHPVPVAEMVATAEQCSTETEDETDVAYHCTLEGQIDPWGVESTEAWFEWGASPNLGESTSHEPIPNTKSEGEEEALVPFESSVRGLRPNATYYYRVAAYDKNVHLPEAPLSSNMRSFLTPYAAPKIVGAPVASFVEPFSAVMFSEVNPENASTEYFFEYVPEAGAGNILEAVCPRGVRQEAVKCQEAGVATTLARGSDTYGGLGVTQEARGLRPATKYHFRFFAESENAAKSEKLAVVGSQESEFTTPAEAKVEVVTGPYELLAPTSAVISGSVNPGTDSVTYAFELGIDAGTATQFGTVFSGNVPAEKTWTPERLALTGLQPGTKYAYRIRSSSGLSSAVGSTMTFAMPELPSSPRSLASEILPPPPFHFPSREKFCKRGYKRSAHGKCVRDRTVRKRGKTKTRKSIGRGRAKAK